MVVQGSFSLLRSTPPTHLTHLTRVFFYIFGIAESKIVICQWTQLTQNNKTVFLLRPEDYSGLNYDGN